uniref:Transmembrane protein n=1 Tax=Sinorhizobium kostiense TaxID=76747 RepID=D1CT40_9HYPH|nr:hypothetical protein [Sinorhizobium kostiense]
MSRILTRPKTQRGQRGYRPFAPSVSMHYQHSAAGSKGRKQWRDGRSERRAYKQDSRVRSRLFVWMLAAMHWTGSFYSALATVSRIISEQKSVQYIDNMNAVYPNNLFSKS